MSKRNKIEAKRAAMLASTRRRIAEVERSYSDALIELMCLQAVRRGASQAGLQPKQSKGKTQ